MFFFQSNNRTVKKTGKYILVVTNHALTLDWFKSPRGPQGAHFMGFQPTRATQSDCVAGQKAPHLRCWSLNAEMDAALRSASIKAEPAKGGGYYQFIQHGDMLKQMDI